MGIEVALGLGAAALGSYLGGNAQSKAAKQAQQLAQQQMQQNQKNYETATGYLSPYATGGNNAFQNALAATGALGSDAQKQYMSNFTGSPYLQGMITNAGNQLMGQYSATGRSPYGGNAMNALYSQNANLWNNAYQQQLQNLNTQAGMGLAAGNSIMSGATGLNNANSALTGNSMNTAMQAGNAQANMYNNIFGGIATGLGKMPSGTISNFLSGTA